MNALIYCAKCRKRTDTHDLIHTQSKTARPMLMGQCAVCDTRKSTFIKMENKKEHVEPDPE